MEQEKQQYYVIRETVFIAENQKELKKYLEENEPEGVMVIKGKELKPEKKTRYEF